MTAFLLGLVLLMPAQAQPADVEIPFRSVGFGKNGKIKDGGAVVIRDAQALEAYRRTMGSAPARTPAVDWTKEEVVALHTAGVGYGGASLQVSKVRRSVTGKLEVEAFLDMGNQPATPTPGVTPVLRREGIYALIVVAKSKGEVTLKVVDPPRDRADKSGKSG